MDKIKKIPLPMAGLILGIAALGNLLKSYSEMLRNLLGLISGLLFILLTLKIFFNLEGSKKELENPVVATVFPTYSMSMMLLATYLKPFIGETAKLFWILGVVLHLGLMLKVSFKYIPNLKIENMFPTWFITYVGIVVASVTGPAFGMESLGRIFFYFGLIAYLVLIPLNLKRAYGLKNIPIPALPTIAVFAAPGSLLLAGYMSSFPVKNLAILYFLLVISQAFYLMVIIQLPKLLKSEFYPSFSAFTFPLVISGLGLKLATKFLSESGSGIIALKYLVIVEEVVASVIVAYVLIKYLNFIFFKEKTRV